ncbi:hypothetical protein [Acaryochloris marina]|uniref:hypothetical protein n=1 Tax=Acaryochloris marina TaxID=155978 RepID=UPI0011D0F276|nr:hypothetical protein [Acaryochloris marina]
MTATTTAHPWTCRRNIWGLPLALQQARSFPGGGSGGGGMREFGCGGIGVAPRITPYYLYFRKVSDTEYKSAYLLWRNK